MIEKMLQESESFKRIIEDIKKGVNPHSYLFISSDKYTAQKMADLTAKGLLCNNLCGKCENCLKVDHPDIKTFPTKDKLLVEDSNKIVEESFIHPIFADRKIFIIRDIDNSTAEAQNKLLKVLEEPNSNIYYILTTSNLENVLPTIRSRCFKVEIGAFSKAEIEKNIKISNEDDREVILALGQGYLGKTIELSKKKNIRELFIVASSVICEMKSSKDVIKYSKRILEKKEDINLIFEIISQILEDLIMLKDKKTDLVKLSFFASELSKKTMDYSMKAICEIEKLIIKAMKELSYFTNLTLVVDNLLMNILEVKYRCR